MTTTRVSGRIWALTGEGGRLYDDVDTDQIYHNRHLHITDPNEMARYALGNLKGWEDFPAKARPSDIIVAGRNFGAGSSRQHAVDCFRALGIGAIVAGSFGAIYRRNAINAGLPIVKLAGLPELASRFATGDWLEIDFESGKLVLTPGEVFWAEPFSRVQLDIYLAGDLFAYGKSVTM
jgi:3-isopropylmalate/(R)-2-methylmalate dehydratase small subunit